jgi:hypothetical protein
LFHYGQKVALDIGKRFARDGLSRDENHVDRLEFTLMHSKCFAQQASRPSANYRTADLT